MKAVKYFTPEEAKKTLPLVKRIVRDVINTGEAMRAISSNEQGGSAENPGVLSLAEKMSQFMAEFEEIGCYYKDWNFSVGLVDFPSIIEGKEVMLCWRSDEEEIRFYHEPNAGYAGRKPIPEEYFYEGLRS